MRRSPLLMIFLIVFLDLVGFGIIIPILPYYAQSFGASAQGLGWLMASYSIAQFFFSPLWGSLSDRVGRRKVLLFTVAGGALAMTAAGLAQSFFLLFLARILAGIFGANISTASAYIADVTTEENRAKGMGIIGAGFGLGFIFGPAIGGILSPYGFSVPIFLAAALNISNFLLLYFLLPEPALSAEARQANRRRIDWKNFFTVIKHPQTGWPIILFFLATLAFTQLEVAFGLYVLNKFSMGARPAGMLLALMGIIMVVIQGGAIGRFSKIFGEKKLVLFGLFCMGIFMFLSSAANEIKLFAICLAGISLGNAFVNPSLSSTVSKKAAVNERGSVMGVYQSAGSLARIIGPPLSGILFDQIAIQAPIWAAGAIMLFTFILAWRME